MKKRSLYVFVLGIVLAAGQVFAQSVSFLSPRLFTAGERPQGLAVGKFNQGNDPDLVVLDATLSGRTSVSLLRGNGDGTFEAPIPISMGVGNPVGIAVGEFNGDGFYLDIAVATSNPNAVIVRLGNGDGTFEDPVSYPLPAQPVGIAVADLNGDILPDLVVSLAGGGLAVLIGGTNVVFEPSIFSVGTSGPLVVGDFNGDRKEDLAIVGEGVVAVLSGNGDGSFQPAVTFAVDARSRSIAVGDMNHDGIPDLITANMGVVGAESGSISLLFGNGDGTFRPAVNSTAMAGSALLAVTDLNGDNFPDLIVANENTIAARLGNGDGTFQPDVILGPFNSISAIVAGDLNGDGRPDIAGTFASPSALVLVNDMPR